MNNNWDQIKMFTDRARDMLIEYWFNETLFSFSWWILFITTLGLLIAWIIIVDRKRIFEIVTYGVMIQIIALISDRIGIFLGLWRYQHKLTPLPSPIEIHIVLMPIIYMIIYQYFNTWKSFLIATIINAFIFAFVLEPFIVWLQVYEPIYWKHMHSFLPYIAISVLCRYIMITLKRKYG